MRSPKSRSRSKSNRPRSVGNIVNRVFDSSGPEGKVRGTPQQIIDKYQVLARDAQLANDRIAAENFLQHSEHYTRMLAEAQREMASEAEARREQQEAQNRNRQRDDSGDQPEQGQSQKQGKGGGGPDRSSEKASEAPASKAPDRSASTPPAETSGADEVIDTGSGEGSSLVPTPESTRSSTDEAEASGTAGEKPAEDEQSAGQPGGRKPARAPARRRSPRKSSAPAKSKSAESADTAGGQNSDSAAE